MTRKTKEIIQKKKQSSGLNSLFGMDYLDLFPHPLYIIDINNYQVVYANKAAGSLIDGKKHYCYKLSHQSNLPCSSTDHICPIEQIRKSKKLVSVEHLHIGENKEKLNVKLIAYPIFNKKRQLTHIVEYSIDITKEKKDKILLEESEERFKSIIESLNDFVFIKNKDLKYTHINSAAEKYFKKPKSKVVGLSDEKLFPKEVAMGNKASDQKVLKGSIFKEQIIININKENRAFLKIKTPLICKNGQIIGVCSIAHDITEARNREQELKAQNKMNIDILENSPVGMFVINEDGMVIFANKKMVEISGTPNEEFFSINFLENEIYKEIGILEKVKKCFKGKKFEQKELKYTQNLDGQEVIRNFIGLPLQETNPTSVLIIVEDITDLKKKEDDLKKRNADLEIFNNIAVKRELRMLELKNEIKKLKEQLDKEDV